MSQHFTAWLCTDSSAVETGCMDVTILEDQPTDEGGWITDPDKPIAFHAVTTVDAKDGTAADGIKQAEELMREAGWRPVGVWIYVGNAHVVTAVRGFLALAEDTAPPAGQWERADEIADAIEAWRAQN